MYYNLSLSFRYFDKSNLQVSYESNQLLTAYIQLGPLLSVPTATNLLSEVLYTIPLMNPTVVLPLNDVGMHQSVPLVDVMYIGVVDAP